MHSIAACQPTRVQLDNTQSSQLRLLPHQTATTWHRSLSALGLQSTHDVGLRTATQIEFCNLGTLPGIWEPRTVVQYKIVTLTDTHV